VNVRRQRHLAQTLELRRERLGKTQRAPRTPKILEHFDIGAAFDDQSPSRADGLAPDQRLPDLWFETTQQEQLDASASGGLAGV
jgi:hypothetical protein